MQYKIKVFCLLRYQTRYKFLWRVILLSHNDLEQHTSEQAQFTTPVILAFSRLWYLTQHTSQHNTQHTRNTTHQYYIPPTSLAYWCVKCPAHNSHQAYYWCVKCGAHNFSGVSKQCKTHKKRPQNISEALSPILYDFQFYSADLLNSVRTTQKHISYHKVIISPTSENFSSFLIES